MLLGSHAQAVNTPQSWLLIPVFAADVATRSNSLPPPPLQPDGMPVNMHCKVCSDQQFAASTHSQLVWR